MIDPDTSPQRLQARDSAEQGSRSDPPLRFISYGGGVQSTALVVLAAQGCIDFDTAVMANVGDDSEHPATMQYVRNIAIPWAAEHGVTIHLLNRTRRDGSTETLWGRLMREGSRSLPIPVRMSNGAPGTRSCTADFKIKVTGKWARQHGASANNPATVAIGISLDEIQRANNRRTEPNEQIVYPLIGIGEDTGLKLSRSQCARIITDADSALHFAKSLPPPINSCYHWPTTDAMAGGVTHDRPRP